MNSFFSLPTVPVKVTVAFPLHRIPAQHHQLSAMEQVGQLRRIDFVQFDVAVDGQLQIGQHGIADLGVQPARLDFDVFGFADIGGHGPAIVGQGIEHSGVDVIADAEGEDARVGSVAWLTFARIFSGLVSPMVGWPSVKKTIVKGRVRPRCACAGRRAKASSMAVPPVASSSSTHLRAASRLSLVAGSRLSVYLLTVVAKFIRPKRSSGERFPGNT